MTLPLVVPQGERGVYHAELRGAQADQPMMSAFELVMTGRKPDERFDVLRHPRDPGTLGEHVGLVYEKVEQRPNVLVRRTEGL